MKNRYRNIAWIAAGYGALWVATVVWGQEPLKKREENAIRARYPMAKSVSKLDADGYDDYFPNYEVVTMVPAPLIVRMRRTLVTGNLGGETVVEYDLWLLGPHVRVIRKRNAVF